MPWVNWGVIGCSSFARRRTIPALLQSPSSKLIGIASRSRDKAESFRSEFSLDRAYGSYDELLADPQINAVYIPLPCGLHAEWMIRSAESGKHCLCEKPFTNGAAEAVRVREAFSGRGLLAAEAFMWRFHSQHSRAAAAVEQGLIGPIRLLRASFTFHFSRRPDIRLVPELGGGSVRDIGCYPISAARFYFADEPLTAFARGEIDPEHGVDMTMSGVLEFHQGRALIDCSFNLPQRSELEIVGERGTIRIPKPWLPDSDATLIVNGETQTLPYENPYVTQFESFSTCIMEGSAPRYGSDDAVRQMRVIDAVLRSMRTGARENV